MKNLVIVESPAKGKTIEKFLGKDYRVVASFGHIRDLPKKDFGIDIEKNFEPKYEIDESKKKVVTELKKLVAEAEKVWIATDEDREGEAIGWHLCKALKLDENTVSRIVFHEITEKAIKEAIAHPRNIDLKLVNSQQSRRLLDRIVGFKTSPVLWKKIRKGLSAGRVQSVAMKLIVEREREIMNFKPEESWKLKAVLEHNGISFKTELAKIGGKGKKLKDEVELKKVLASLGISEDSLKEQKDKKGNIFFEIKLNLDFKLENAEKKESERMPGAPFTTSTLQQEASRKLGFSVAQTMTVAQGLYQNGHITYMRTDSVNLSDLAIGQAHDYIEKNFGKEYTLKGGRKFKNKQANAQEAHEAIRPTYIDKSPDQIKLEGNELRLYKLIWERTVASQMKEAIVETTTYHFNPLVADNQEWISKGEVVKFPGFMKLYVEGTDDEEDDENGTGNLPLINIGEIVKSLMLVGNQTFSNPPARYTEAALVKKLEKEGIGRPSTYASIISVIIERGYIVKEDKKLRPEEIAFTVNDFLEMYFTDLMDYKFTAGIENELDEIAIGNIDRIEMLKKFYAGYEKELTKSLENSEKVVEKTGGNCPDCGKELVYKYSKTGKFIGCSGYPECKYLENIVDEEKEKYLDELRAEYEGKPCEAGGTIVVKTGRFGPFLASSLYPEVKWIGKIQNKADSELAEKYKDEVCDKCGAQMVVKKSRRGPFLACSAYPECKNAKNFK